LDYSSTQKALQVAKLASPGRTSPDFGGADGGSPSPQGSSPSPVKIRELLANTSPRYNGEILNHALNKSFEQMERGPDALQDEAGLETAFKFTLPPEGSFHHQQERPMPITSSDPAK
jgi:hypothetical protein